jgi:SAM-dependent methyltransferase
VSVQRHWDENAAAWIAWARKPGHDSYWRFHRDAFLELLPEPRRRTLDVGCGEGRLTRELAARGHDVVGVDRSGAMIEAAREADSSVELHVADAAALPFDDGAFDLAIAFMSLMNMADIGAALAEVARVLEPGGRVCVAITHPLNTAGRFVSREPDAAFVVAGSYFDHHEQETAAERDGLTMTFLDSHWPLQHYTDALTAAGFKLEALREVAEPDDPRWSRVPLFLHLRARRH